MNKYNLKMKKNLNLEKDFNNKLGITEKEYMDNLPNINKEEYSDQNRYISADVPRTTEDKNISGNLEEILKVFSITNGGLGYKSGMSFIVKTLLELTNNNKIKTYIIMRNIFENKDLHNLYDGQFQNVINKLELKFKEKMPSLYQHFKNNNFHIDFSFSLLTTLFCYNFDENIAKELLKIFIVKNDFDLYLNAYLTILKINEEELLNKKYEEIYSLMINYKTFDINKYFETLKQLNE